MKAANIATNIAGFIGGLSFITKSLFGHDIPPDIQHSLELVIGGTIMVIGYYTKK